MPAEPALRPAKQKLGRVFFGARLGATRQRAVDHADGVVEAIDRGERAKARTFLLPEQHLVEHVEPVERDARLAILGLLLLIEERLAAADFIDKAAAFLPRA
jgi:hypothetical protein